MRHRRKAPLGWQMQGWKSLGQHEWNAGDVRTHCVKCRVSYHQLYANHWNSEIKKADWCHKAARPTTINLRSLRRLLR